MALQTPEQAAAQLDAGFRRHPSVAQTDANINLIVGHIAKHFSTVGETVLNPSYVDLAFANLAGQLQLLAGPEVGNQIAAATQQAADLKAQRDAETAEHDRQERIRERDRRIQGEQDARQPGVRSAYSGKSERDAQDAKDREDAHRAYEQAQRHEQFRKQLHEANIYWEANHAHKNDKVRAMKENLRRQYPEFASEIR